MAVEDAVVEGPKLGDFSSWDGCVERTGIETADGLAEAAKSDCTRADVETTPTKFKQAKPSQPSKHSQALFEQSP